MPTTTKSFRYPSSTDTVNVPRDIQYLATDIDNWITNNPITINGSPVSLGGTVTITGLPSQIGNTGGAGGGGSNSPQGNGGAGGSGIVIVRTLDTVPTASSYTGTLYNTGGYKYYKFTSTGSITF